MEKFETVVKVRSKQKQRRVKVKRNVLTTEILQQFSVCSNAKQSSSCGSTENLRKYFKYDYSEEEVVPDMQTFQSKALEIDLPGPEFDPTTIPQNGNEFLKKMYYERERCPIIVQCPLPANNSKQTAKAVVPLDVLADFREKLGEFKFKTTPEWVNAQTCTFLQSRGKVTVMRMNMQSKELNVEEVQLPTSAQDITKWQSFCRAHEPRLSIILQFGQRQLELLLEYLSSWLQDSIDVESKHTTDEQQTLDTLSLRDADRWLGLWIYATLVCLDLPLEPQVHSTLRDIARSCVVLRSRLCSDDERHAQQYNIFLAIIVCIYRQFDFKEFLYLVKKDF